MKGGNTGAPSDVRIRRADGKIEPKPSKFLTGLLRDDVIEIKLAGGGGYGNALARFPERVLNDVREEKISVDHAATAYGVVITGNPPAIDAAATSRLRTEKKEL